MQECKLNKCSEYVFSGCVLFTGTLIEGSYITLPACNATLNNYLSEVDKYIKELKDKDGILRTTLISNNCNLTHITNLITNNLTTKIDTTEVVLALLNTICTLNSRIITLETKDIFETTLPQEIQLILNGLSCFTDDPCYPDTLTLKELLIKIINKLCP